MLRPPTNAARPPRPVQWTPVAAAPYLGRMHHARLIARATRCLPVLAAAWLGASRAAPCLEPLPPPPAPPPGWQATEQLSSPATGPVTTSAPALAVNAKGTVLVAWHARQPKPLTQPPVYEDRVQVARHTRCEGWTSGTLGPALSLPPQGAPVEAAIDAQGRAWVAWRAALPGHTPLVVSEAAPGGDFDFGSVVAAGAMSDLPITYRLGVTGNGEAFLAWTDSQQGLQLVRRPSAGAWTAPLQLEGPATVYTLSFGLAVSTGGSAVVHWSTGDFKGHVRRYAGGWSAVHHLAAQPSLPGPLAVDATGRAVVVRWQIGKSPRVSDYDPAFGWSPDVAVAGFERSLGVALDSSGRAVMFGGPAGNGIAVVRRPDGAWRAPAVMGGIDGWPQVYQEPVADIGIDGNGRALMVWLESGVVWARHHRGECTGWNLNCGWGPTVALSAGPLPAEGRPRAAVAADGRAVVVWRQGTDLFLRRYQP